MGHQGDVLLATSGEDAGHQEPRQGMPGQGRHSSQAPPEDGGADYGTGASSP